MNRLRRVLGDIVTVVVVLPPMVIGLVLGWLSPKVVSDKDSWRDR